MDGCLDRLNGPLRGGDKDGMGSEQRPLVKENADMPMRAAAVGGFKTVKER